MANNGLLLPVLTLVFIYSTCSDVQTPDASLKEHVKKIDEMLAEMQSHSQAQEQKYSAVLSSLLSQLTQTSDELGDIKTRLNDTILKLEETDAKLSELSESHNATIVKLEDKTVELSKVLANHNATILKLDDQAEDLSKLWASYNATILKLEAKDGELSLIRAGHNATELELIELRAKHKNVAVDLEETISRLENCEQHTRQNGNIGFHGAISKNSNVTDEDPILFDKILYMGATYNESSGKYIVPKNGTYQIWLDIKYQRPKEAVVFNIHKDDHIIDQAYGSTSDATTSTLTMLYLRKGDSIWVTTKQSIHFDKSYCHFGIVLLNAH